MGGPGLRGHRPHEMQHPQAKHAVLIKTCGKLGAIEHKIGTQAVIMLKQNNSAVPCGIAMLETCIF
jgi:hypothetical protein